ncbi:polyheme membrane-associated cytochrome c [Ferroglobus placidus DSM 10642]|uniref:Polyheme membrane-associated cytochrome c n=1 Tax=Ferroglobus placidus (strain DSM 10642 / AEDII12DO) TaxID=589924 RepID=D3RWL9_FERPA|nr:ammonia-forming cytochrome c nitrite reductase subunit c552 [Ferroglobus placidus]ADC64882.1 polyheme membrane-associated cytochrome c [Ferroglobus placidus DSM 10642]
MRAKYLAVLLVLLAVFLAGCSGQQGKTATTPTPTPEKTPTPIPTPDIEKIKQEAAEEAIGEAMVLAINTHFDDPNTDEIEGVNVNPEFGCQGCHFGKEAVPRMIEWGKSAHGGHLLEVKEKDLSAAITEEIAPAWAHYDFKQKDRQPCQNCHTSTGFRNFASNPENYNPANNTFLLVGKQKELLYCWACHKVEDRSFQLRNPGKFEKIASYSEPAERIAAVPDLGAANLCMVCHSGRSSGAAIKAAGNIKTHFGAFNSHYLAAGGVIFKLLPYEFDGREYADYNPHESINDLCVACHMPKGSHEFKALKKEGDSIVITAYEETCKKCHGDEEELKATIEEREAQYKATLDYIQQLLANKGIYYDISAYPYFYPSPNPQDGRGPPNAFKDWPDKNTLGAAYNLNLFAHEPGAFVHNPKYVKQVLYDTIDFLDDGELNDSVLNNAPEKVKAFLEGAR